MAFLTVTETFLLFGNNLTTVRTLTLFVILDAVLCALKCIFLLIDSLLRHISTTLF